MCVVAVINDVLCTAVKFAFVEPFYSFSPVQHRIVLMYLSYNYVWQYQILWCRVNVHVLENHKRVNVTV